MTASGSPWSEIIFPKGSWASMLTFTIFQMTAWKSAPRVSCFPTAASVRIKGSSHTAIVENKRLSHALAIIKYLHVETTHEGRTVWLFSSGSVGKSSCLLISK